ncbi:MAG: hypothetical protein A2428_06190 [Bdellovibrionales bacterium RIFOXYC1_FULL_54_43]|nr:MAG: hypothetical protein A2428_06190 [Bdellovibrionales bacterium RIFOXYC1_FULL_54_43]OFZ78913.1 MAG: hypothetical protein A2603_10725 [Bdellovibrionales bacterium RIFOXYD1_FULL_55_31]
MDRPPQVLICDDDQLFHLAVKQSLKNVYACRSAYNTDEAIAILSKNPFDAILLDIQMRTSDEGLRAISRLKECDPDIAIIMSSGLTDFNAVREAMRLGATDYVVKDFEQNELTHVISRALERRSLLQRREQQNFEVLAQQRQHVLVGRSLHILALRKTIERIRQSPANAVITGETGTGKEVVARQLRRTLVDGSLAPFVAVDSATIQSSTAESLLFGHEKGAFTGAEKTTKGIFEEANGGIVYFDEISNMPLEIQAKLLRVLQEKEVVRLGSARVIQLSFRVICATNKDLDQMVREGKFKDDLLQRLNVLPIELAPLRQRKEDIPLLVEHFLSKQPASAASLRFTPEAVDLLQSYSWPGNIRELGNLVSYLVAMVEGPEVDISDLPPKFRDAVRCPANSPAPDPVPKDGTFYDRVAEFERGILADEYSKMKGNISRLALVLGMDRSHLYTKLREYRIHSGRSEEKTDIQRD